MGVEALRPELAVERLDERVVGWLALPGEVEHDILLISPQVEVARDELGTLVDADRARIAALTAHPLERGYDIFSPVVEPRIDRG